MTLILSAITPEFALQASDRRGTRSRGRPVETLSKAVIFACPTARFAVGYSGLAQYGAFYTRNWMLDTLKECGAPDYDARGIIARFIERANRDLAAIPKAADRRLTIMMSGFRANENPNGAPVPTSLLITNFQHFDRGDDDPEPWDEFRLFPREPEPDGADYPCDFQRIGSYADLDPYEADALAMLRGGAGAEAVRERFESIIREVAQEPRNAGRIGSNIMTIVVPAAFDSPASGGFSAADAGHVLYLPDMVRVFPGEEVVTRDFQLAAVDPAGPPLVVGPQPRKRPCACGSGKKYKHCHGKR